MVSLPLLVSLVVLRMQPEATVVEKKYRTLVFRFGRRILSSC